jgi:hypothetical protein
MRFPRWILLLLFVGALGAVAAAMYEKQGGIDEFGPYQPVVDWFKPVRAGYIERGASVFAESPNRIIFTSDLEFPVAPRRNGNPKLVGLAPAPPVPVPPASSDLHFVMIVDGNGNVVDEWKQWAYLFKCPHEVQISPYDPQRSV